jgi:hypothetical protein
VSLVDINTIQDIAHAYLLELPLAQRVEIMRDVLGVDVCTTWSIYKQEEHTKSYINWMRVDESQKIFDFLHL